MLRSKLWECPRSLARGQVSIVSIHQDFIESITSLNNSVVWYNNRKTNKLYTIAQALQIFDNTTPSIIQESL